MTESKPDTIPRIDKVGYLYETLGWINDGATFEEIREAQIEYRKNLDRDNFVDKRSGASSVRQLQKRTDRETYWTNTRATVSELIHLGLVEQGPVPSRKEQIDVYREQRYQVTELGAQFFTLMEQNFWVFQDSFAQLFILAHPSLRQLLTHLAHRDLFIPRLGTEDLRGHLQYWRETPALLPLIEDVCARVSAAGGPDIAPERLFVVLEAGVLTAWNNRDPTLKNYDFNKSIVKAINDQLLRAMAALHGLPLNVVDFRAAISLLTGLYAVDSSHSLIGRTGWTIWSTSNPPPTGGCRGSQSPMTDALAGSPWFIRRTLTEAVLQEEIIKSVLSIPNREGGFALIHEVRAQVCHGYRIHSRSFNELLRKMHHGEIKHPVYNIYLDRGGYAYLPPSELPFLNGGRDFYLITFIPNMETHHGTRQ